MLVTGDKLVVEVKEVNADYIFFSIWPDSVNVTKLPLDRVYGYTSSDGKTHQFNLKPEEEKVVKATMPDDTTAIKAMAQADARQHYNYSIITGIGTFFTTVFATPVVGLFVAIPVSATPPVDKSLNPPDTLFFKNSTYYDAYKKEAHKIKKRRVWTAFGIGVLVETMIVAVFVSQMNHDDSLLD